MTVGRWEIAYLRDHQDAIPQIAQWTHDHWAVVTPKFKMSVADRARRLEPRAQVGRIPTGFVALVEGQVVGLACLVDYDMDTRRDLSPWLATVFVAAEHRGRGIGRGLSERATREAAELGHSRLYLVTYDQEGFYRRLGWSLLERTSYYDYPMIVMTRDLSAHGARLLPPG